MFTQKQLAQAFEVTPQAITMALRGTIPIERVVEKSEGERLVRRVVKTYSQDAAFRVAVRSGKLPAYHELCLENGIAPVTYNVTRMEVQFGRRLRDFLPPEIEIVTQYRTGGYRLDFFIPSHNVAIEYDEPHHMEKVQSKADLRRSDEITAAYGTIFIRVSQGKEESGLFQIAKAILTDH